MEDKEIHPLVELLLARMKSHPEEFAHVGGSRWCSPITAITEYGSDEDKATLREGLRTVFLDAAHSEALDELLNGGERRRNEKERYEAQSKYYAQSQVSANQQAAYRNAYPQTMNTLAGTTSSPTLWERITKGSRT